MFLGIKIQTFKARFFNLQRKMFSIGKTKIFENPKIKNDNLQRKMFSICNLQRKMFSILKN